MRGARPSSRHCPESGRACALSRRHRHRRAWGAESRCATHAGRGRCAAGARAGTPQRGGRTPRLFVPRPARLQAPQRGSLGVPVPFPAPAKICWVFFLLLLLQMTDGCSPIYDRVYLPQMCSINTAAMNRRLITSTGTGPTLSPGESSV